jgi:hypothetical protein
LLTLVNRPDEVHDNASKVQHKQSNSDTKELGDDRLENGSTTIMARSRKVTFYIGNDGHVDAGSSNRAN